MQIEIKTREFPLTDALRSHTERRLFYALSRLDEPIQRLVIRLSDINGPRGGVDKYCRLQLVLVGAAGSGDRGYRSGYVCRHRSGERPGRAHLGSQDGSPENRFQQKGTPGLRASARTGLPVEPTEQSGQDHE
jgi:putative sigma-54 modulation protein